MDTFAYGDDPELDRLYRDMVQLDVDYDTKLSCILAQMEEIVEHSHEGL